MSSSFDISHSHISKVSVEAATATATAAEQVPLKAAQSSRTTIPTTIRSTRSCFFHLRSTRDLWQKTYFLKDKTYDISVAAGKTIKMTFAAFSLENAYRCGWDYLMVFHHCWFWSILTLASMFIVDIHKDLCWALKSQIVDGNGNTLLDKSCGSIMPYTGMTVTSETNK